MIFLPFRIIPSVLKSPLLFLPPFYYIMKIRYITPFCLLKMLKSCLTYFSNVDSVDTFVRLNNSPDGAAIGARIAQHFLSRF